MVFITASGVICIILFILIKMENLFNEMKNITIITRLLRAISTLLYVITGPVLVPERITMINAVSISLSSLIKWSIMLVASRSFIEFMDN